MNTGTEYYSKQPEYSFTIPKYSKWVCYLFGGKPDFPSITWRPLEGKEPNWFVRLMMKIFFDCTWIKDK